MIIMAAEAISPSFLAAQNAMNLTIVNQSGYPDDQVYFIMICQTPLGYLDFQNHVLVETPSFNLDVATMTATLAQLKNYSGDGTCTIPCPAMGSSRIYFCFGQNFDQMGGFASSGPDMGSSNPIPWDMFELNLSSGKFLDQSNVDFFSIAYTLTVNPSSGGTVTVGITTPSETIFGEFAAILSPADSAQQYGNSDIFKAMIVANAAGETIRVIAPKAAALGDVNYNDSLPQEFTHFLDDYVNNYCWKPDRTFSFSSKLASDTATYYGKVSADGLNLYIYTDAAMTIPYTVSSLPRPSNAWGSPDFKNKTYLWHNVGVTSAVPADIDWGYLLYGQDGYSPGPGAYWITDPVAMAIPVSIVRGVMHLDNGTIDWKDSSKYYLGTNGASTSAFPIFYYGQILHRYGIAGRVYALSFDDVYGNDSGIGFTDPAVTMTIYPFKSVLSPTGVNATKGAFSDRVRITWNAVTNATSYEVWRNAVNDSSAATEFSTEPATAIYDDTSVTVGTTYYYWVKAKNASATSVFSSSDSGYASATVVVPSAPRGVSASKGTYQNKIVISWNIVTNAANYEVWRNTANNSSSATKLATEPALSSYEDTSVTANTVYYYWLKAKNSAGTSSFSASDMGFASASGDTRWLPAPGDFDGDAKTDPAVYQPLTGTWKTRLSSAGYLTITTPAGFLGGTNYQGLAADLDGDRKADPTIYNSAATNWIVLLSSANYQALYLPAFLGGTNWVALAADFDGDQIADPTVYESATANWSIKLSGAGYSKLDLANFFGGAGWTALGADFDGDQIADPAIYDNATGAWSLKLSVSGYAQIDLSSGWLGGSVWQAAVGDYDGDRLADPTIYNPATGDWSIKLSSGNYTRVDLPGFLGGL